MANMRIVGDGSTSYAVYYKNESQKLAHSFPVKTGDTIVAGQPVVLNTDGTISPVASTSTMNDIIGIAITNSATPAYKANLQYGSVEVTVFVKGYAIIYGVAAAAGQTAGRVAPTGALDETSKYEKYAASTAVTDIKFISLSTAAAAGDLIQILVQ